MQQQVFNDLRDIIHRHSGISLRDDRAFLVESRLSTRLHALGLTNEGEYLELLRREPEELPHLIDAISTNFTHFFREPTHFSLLARLANEWRKHTSHTIRVWSAACATGEEPYSIAMTLLDSAGPSAGYAKVLATDISKDALRSASRGCYDAQALRHVSEAQRNRHFRETHASEWRARDSLRRMVTFRHHNLMELPLPGEVAFDLVMCRNVMIYFDEALRAHLVKGFYQALRPGGLLLIGHSESLAGIADRFEQLEPSVFRKPTTTAPSS